jgi:hypothetical protein
VQIPEQLEIPESLETGNEGDISLDELEPVTIHRKKFIPLINLLNAAASASNTGVSVRWSS